MTAVHGRVVATSRADPRVRVVGVVIAEQSTVIVTGHFAPGLFELRAGRGLASELLGCLGETVQASVTLEYDASVNAVGGEIHGWRPLLGLRSTSQVLEMLFGSREDCSR